MRAADLFYRILIIIIYRTEAVMAGFRGGAGGKQMTHGIAAMNRHSRTDDSDDAAYLFQATNGCYMRTTHARRRQSQNSESFRLCDGIEFCACMAMLLTCFLMFLQRDALAKVYQTEPDYRPDMSKTHSHGDSKAPEQQLISKLMETYNPDGRPVNNPADPVNVTLQFFLMQINELDEKSQVLSTTGWLELNWMDEQLIWDPAEHHNITTLVLPATQIWLPDVALDNTASKVYDLSHRADFRVLVHNNGKVWWPPGGLFATACQVDVSYYPFDRQLCVLKFTNWVFQAYHVSLTNGSTSIGLEYFHANGEWDVIETESYTVSQYFSCCDEPFVKVYFDIYLRRRSTFYLMNVLLPFLMISFLILMVFCLPPEAGEKVSLGTTLLLSFSVFQLLIADNMPQTSQYIPIVSIYLTIFMAMTTLSIILSVVILRIHHHGEATRVPSWLRFVVFQILARVIMRDAYTSWKIRIHEQKRLDRISTKDKIGPFVAMNGYMGGGVHCGDVHPVPGTTTTLKAAGATTKSNYATVADPFSDSSDNISLLEAIDRDVKEINEMRFDRTRETSLEDGRSPRIGYSAAYREERKKKMDEEERQQRETLNFEWRLVAKVMDKVFFVTFLIMMTVSTTVICWEVVKHQ